MFIKYILISYIFIFIFFYLFLGEHLDELDPLPNEDVSVTDENVSHNSFSHQTNGDCITINVTNEHGQKILTQPHNG